MLILNLMNIGLIIVILVMTCSFTHKVYLIIKADRQEKYERKRLHNMYKKLQEEKARGNEKWE